MTGLSPKSSPGADDGTRVQSVRLLALPSQSPPQGVARRCTIQPAVRESASAARPLKDAGIRMGDWMDTRSNGNGPGEGGGGNPFARCITPQGTGSVGKYRTGEWRVLYVCNRHVPVSPVFQILSHKAIPTVSFGVPTHDGLTTGRHERLSLPGGKAPDSRALKNGTTRRRAVSEREAREALLGWPATMGRMPA